MSDPAARPALEQFSEAIQEVKRQRFFRCCTNGCKTDKPKCEHCVFLAKLVSLLEYAQNEPAREQQAIAAFAAHLKEAAIGFDNLSVAEYVTVECIDRVLASMTNTPESNR